MRFAALHWPECVVPALASQSSRLHCPVSAQAKEEAPQALPPKKTLHLNWGLLDESTPDEQEAPHQDDQTSALVNAMRSLRIRAALQPETRHNQGQICAYRQCALLS